MKTSVYKSETARDTMRAYYNQILSQFPFEQRYVDTRFGQTFLLTAGQESNPPVLLLHGSCSNSAFWFPEIMALSGQFRVYAVDIIGEAGNSEQYRPDLESEDFALWLGDVLDALALEQTALVGNSLGGWMALKFATTYPRRVSRLALIASAGLAAIRPQFLERTEQLLQADVTVPMDKTVLGEQEIPPEALHLMKLILDSYHPIPSLPVYEDDQIKRLCMPVLFIDGVEDAIIDAEQSAQRLSSLVPGSEIHLLPHTGHMVVNSMELMGPFLNR